METINTSQHTPAPWTAYGVSVYAPEAFNTKFDGRLRDFKRPVCIVDGDPMVQDAFFLDDGYRVVRVPGEQEAYANARLIAAAPDLLNMLIRLHSEVMMSEDCFRHIAPLTLEHVRNAIAKATA